LSKNIGAALDASLKDRSIHIGAQNVINSAMEVNGINIM